MASVPRNELRFLHKDFNVLPAQAIQASLSGIQPPNGRQSFTMEANKALLGLVADKHLIGLVQRIEPEVNEFYLILKCIKKGEGRLLK